MKRLILGWLVSLLISSFAQTSFASLYDDFNDNSLNTNKWDVWVNSYPGTTYFTESRQSLNIDGNSSDRSERAGLNAKTVLGGDFDITIKWQDWSYSGNTGSYKYDPASIGMQITNIYDSNDFLYMFRGAFPSTDGNRYVSNAKLDGTFQTSNEVNTTDSNGYFKITREGSTISSYYSTDKNNWQNLKTVNNAFTDPARLSLTGYTGDYTNSFHAELDNVDVVADSIIDGTGERRALIIGLGDYDGVQDLPGATLDARRMSLVLQNLYGFQTDVILDKSNNTSDNVTKNQIKNEIINFLGKSDSTDQAVIYFSGHGGTGGIYPYLSIHEGTTAGSDKEINSDELMSWLKNYAHASNTNIILQECFSGDFVDSYNTYLGGKNYLLTSLQKGQLFATEDSDPNVGGGIFTNMLLDGLSGGNYVPTSLHYPKIPLTIDSNGDKILTLEEAFNYAKTETEVITGLRSLGTNIQHPQLNHNGSETQITLLDKDFYKKASLLTFRLDSPAHLIITDPLGRILSEDNNEIGDNVFY